MLALFSAVPVLPAIGTGKVPKTAVEVPLAPCVACSKPWRTTSRKSGSSLTVGAGGGAKLCRTRPGACLLLTSSTSAARSEEHTSELQSHVNLVCRLLLEKQ